MRPQLVQRVHADIGHRRQRLVAHDRQRLARPGLAGHGHAPEGVAAAEHGLGAQGQGLHDIGAAADAAVEQDGGLVAHLGDDAGQHVDRGDGDIKVTAAVVGDHDAVRAAFHGDAGILRVHDALHDQRAGPAVAQAVHVVPREVFGVLHAVAERALRDRGAELLRVILEAREAAVLDHVAADGAEQPMRRQGHVDHGAQRGPVGEGEAVGLVVGAVRGDRRVHGEEQCLEPVVLGAVHQLHGKLAILPQIELHEVAAVRHFAGDLLHRGLGAGGERVGNAGLRRGLGQRQLALIGHEARGAGGGDDVGHGDGLAEQLRGDGPLADVFGEARHHLQAVEGRAVLVQQLVVLAAPVDVFEDAARQQPAGCIAKLVDIVAVIENAHGVSCYRIWLPQCCTRLPHHGNREAGPPSTTLAAGRDFR